MTKIPTLYSDYRECMLDLDIYGKIVATPQQSIQELTETLFEEFQRRKPMPTLEYKRYELSRLVNPDFRIAYNKELELQDNERLLDLQSNLEASFENIDFEDLTSLIPTTKELFSYENHVTDNMRNDIIEKYDLSTGETFKPGINQTENIVGSTSEDDSLTLTEEKIARLGVDESEADVTMAEDPMEVVSFKSDDDEDVKYEVDDDELEDYDSFESDSENDSESDLEEESEDISEEDDSESIEDDNDGYDNFDSEEDDSEDFDYTNEDDEVSDYDDYDSEEDEETTEDIVDEDYDSEDEDSEEELDDDDYSSDEEEYDLDSEDESDDDYSSDEEEDGLDSEEELDDDYASDYEEDSDDEDYSSDSEDDLDEEGYDDYDSDFEETSDDDYEDYDSDSDDEDYSEPVEEVEDTDSSESEEKIKKSNGVAEESIDLDSDNFDVSSFIDSVQDEQVTKQFEPIVNKVVKTPITPLEARVNNPPQSEIIDRSAEPTEIRAFLRKHPRCEYDFALKYFTKKQINDAIKIGKIIKKGNILKI